MLLSKERELTLEDRLKLIKWLYPDQYEELKLVLKELDNDEDN